MGKTLGVSHNSKLIAEKIRLARKMGDESDFTLEKFKELMEQHANFKDPEEILDHEQDTKLVYNLKLHEHRHLSTGYKVTRVPGGWIYDRNDNSVFVPFVLENNENSIKL